MGSHPGSNIPAGHYSSRDGLLLSVDSPSQCHGNVTQWNFCYRRSQPRQDTYSVQFMIYRESGSTLVYNRLPSSITVFEQNNLVPRRSCLSIPLNSAEQFEIQPNDVIGVCMKDQGSIHPLYVSSDTRDDAISVSGISNDCTDDQLSSLNFNSLSRQNVNYLLVETLIGKLFNIFLLLLF